MRAPKAGGFEYIPLTKRVNCDLTAGTSSLDFKIHVRLPIRSSLQMNNKTLMLIKFILCVFGYIPNGVKVTHRYQLLRTRVLVPCFHSYFR